MKLEDLEKMLEYNIAKGASKKTLAEIRGAIQTKRKELGLSFSKDIGKLYNEDLHRGEGGGSSEGGANTAALKTLMKDNRIRETKYTQSKMEELRQTTAAFVEEHKLDKDFQKKPSTIIRYKPKKRTVDK